MTAKIVPVETPDDAPVYLRTYLRPLERWLSQPNVTEILINKPGEVWVESADQPQMQRFVVPDVDAQLLQRLASQIARASHQGISREAPLLSATLPGGARVQIIAAPATRQHMAVAIRKYVLTDMNLEGYAALGTFDGARRSSDASTDMTNTLLHQQLDSGDIQGFLRAAVAARKTILISGGTSTGKTTFLNALMKEIPGHERIIAVEDTPEIQLSHANSVGLIAVKGEMGEARVGVDDLLQAALRLRPDRLIVGELRGAEAATFLRAINTGHPGSLSTVHADSPAGALEQIALMVLQSGMRLTRSEIISYVRSIVDIVVQFERRDGKRQVSEILFAPVSS